MSNFYENPTWEECLELYKKYKDNPEIKNVLDLLYDFALALRDSTPTPYTVYDTSEDFIKEVSYLPDPNDPEDVWYIAQKKSQKLTS